MLVQKEKVKSQNSKGKEASTASLFRQWLATTQWVGIWLIL